MSSKILTSCLALMLMLSVASDVWAAPKSKAASQKSAAVKLSAAGREMDKLANRVLALGKKWRRNERRFQREVDDLLNEVTDFNDFARRVMGQYATSQALQALSQSQRNERQRQIDRFIKIFRRQLVIAFSNAFLLAASDGAKIETLPSQSKRGRDIVRQRAIGITDNPVEIHYQMELTGNRWLIRNIALAGINVGKLYRGQFQQLAKDHKGDLNKVIASWVDSEDR